MVRSFYSKMSLALVGCFMIIGLCLVFFVKVVSQNYQNEVEQKLHVDLAKHLVQDSPDMKTGRFDYQALKSTFHTMMMLGPSFEFYLLDPQGKILTYDAEPGKVKRSSVNLAPIHSFISKSEHFPILGDDPRNLDRQKIFSVAEVVNEGGLQGYLYIIIGGEKYDGIVNLIESSHIAQLGLWLVASIIVFGLFVSLVLFRYLTRPLRTLSAAMQSFSQRGFERSSTESSELPLSEWSMSSSDEIERLGGTFHHMAEVLTTQYDKIKTTDELRRELISYVSHDLRTPLASLQGYLETWQLHHQTMPEAQAKALIDVAEKNALQVSRLVEQLFELAHLESETVQLSKESVCIAELVSDVVQTKSFDADKKGVSLKMISGFENLSVQANVERLERVFTNLIDNAIRHCEEGDEVLIELNQARMTSRKPLDSDAYSNCVEIQIKDSGCGIPEDSLSRIFDPHFRASNTVSGKSSGSGLGLAIVRRILELHDSEIKVTSQVGFGTSFKFQLCLI